MFSRITLHRVNTSTIAEMAYPDAYSRQSEALSGRTEARSHQFPSDFLLKSFSFDCIIGNERPAAAGKSRHSPQRIKRKTGISI